MPLTPQRGVQQFHGPFPAPPTGTRNHYNPNGVPLGVEQKVPREDRESASQFARLEALLATAMDVESEQDQFHMGGGTRHRLQDYIDEHSNN
jgi:hypothetical protein